MAKADCPLCDLSKQEVVYEDDHCFCTVILEPLKDGHLMILPKRHVINLEDLKPEESQSILELLTRLSKIIPEIYSEDPIIFMNLGKHSTQPHTHFHILPSKGGLRDLFSNLEKIPKRVKATPEELRKISKKIKIRLK